MKHYVCSNEFMKRSHDITSKGGGCPFCNGNQKAKYNEEWVIKTSLFLINILVDIKIDNKMQILL